MQQIRSQSHRPATFEQPMEFGWQDRLGKREFPDFSDQSSIGIHEVVGPFRHWDERKYRLFIPTKGAFAYRTPDGFRVVADAAHMFITAPGELFDVEPLGRVDQFRGLLLVPPEELLPLGGPPARALNVARSVVRAAKSPLEALLLANRILVLSSFGEAQAAVEAATKLVAMGLSAPMLPRISKSSPIVDRLKVQLNETFHQRSSLTELAAQVGKSPSLLTQMFTRSQDLSFYQYQLKIRLSAALAGLFGRHSITEVAYDVGFSSHSHFSVQFRRAFGMSPSQCRLYLSSL